MGKEIGWIREEPTGRLIYRRRYAADVQRTTGKWELKVPFAARWRITAEASQTYHQACERFDREVRAARASVRLKEKERSGTFDGLTPADIDYLAGVLIHDHRSGMEQRLRQGHGRTAGIGWAWLLPQLREIRLAGNADLLEQILGPTLDGLLASEGFLLDPADQGGACGRAVGVKCQAGQLWDDIERHLQGYAPPIPSKSERPANPRGGPRTVAALTKAYKAAKWDGWSQSSRTAVEPPFRALQDAIGDKLVTDIDREAAREVFELVKSLRAALEVLAAMLLPSVSEGGASQDDLDGGNSNIRAILSVPNRSSLAIRRGWPYIDEQVPTAKRPISRNCS